MSGPNWRCIGPWPLCGHPRNTCTASPAYQAAIKVKHASSMTTTDIAGLCERLKTLWLELNDVHAEPPATARIMNALHQSGDTLERQAAEIDRLQNLLNGRDDFIVGQGLWPKFCDGLPPRAALTGEDTAGSPTSQNTEPGLAFSDAGEP